MLPKFFSSAPEDSKDSLSTTATDHEGIPPQPQEGSATKPLESEVQSDKDIADKPTKMSQATDIYRRMTRKKGATRKEIVAAFMDEVGLTKAGSATYYQMIKKGRR